MRSCGFPSIVILHSQKSTEIRTVKGNLKRKRKPPLMIDMSKKEIPNAFVCSCPIIW